MTRGDPSSQPQEQEHSDYIFSPEDPEQLEEQRRIEQEREILLRQHQESQTSTSSSSTHPFSPVALSERYQQLTMDQQEQKSLVRIQVLTPLSVLVQMTVSLICGSGIIKPTLQTVSRRHPTYLTTQESFVLLYWAVLYLLMVGFSLFVLLSRTPETKKAIVHGVGTRLALANYMMVLWAIFWVLDRHFTFVLGTAALGVIAALLLFNVLVLSIKYRPSARHPLVWLFIHVPTKMFLAITLEYDLWQQLFIAIRWDRGNSHEALVKGLWPAFGIISGTAVVMALWIFATCDWTLTLAGIYLNVALLWHDRFPITGAEGEARPAALTAAIILSISLQSVALIASLAWKRIQAHHHHQGRISLPVSPDEEAAAIRAEAEHRARASMEASQDNAVGNNDDGGGNREYGSTGQFTATRNDEEALIESNRNPSAGHSKRGSQDIEVTRTLGASTAV